MSPSWYSSIQIFLFLHSCMERHPSIPRRLFGRRVWRNNEDSSISNQWQRTKKKNRKHEQEMTSTITATATAVSLYAFKNEIMNSSRWEMNARPHYTHTRVSTNEWVSAHRHNYAQMNTRIDNRTEQEPAHSFPELLATLFKLYQRSWRLCMSVLFMLEQAANTLKQTDMNVHTFSNFSHLEF